MPLIGDKEMMQERYDHNDKFLYYYINREDAKIEKRALWWQKQNLMYTLTGYGKKIPTTEMIRFNNRWYRIYCCIFSNSGTCYIKTKQHGNIIIN